VDGTPARLLSALTQCAPLLAQEPVAFQPIIDEVLNSPMSHLVEGLRRANTAESFELAAQRARDAMRPLLNFLAGLVSANSALLPAVFHSIAQKLLPREGDGGEDSDDDEDDELNDTDIPEHDPRNTPTPKLVPNGGQDSEPASASNGTRDENGNAKPPMDRAQALTIRRLRRRARPWEKEEPRIEGLYGCTHSLLLLVPTGLPALFEALKAAFPHRRQGVGMHRAYTRRLLRLAQALPALEDRLLSIVVDRMVEIDVEISIHDVDEDQNREHDAAVAVSQEHSGPAESQVHIETLADKLDVMIELVFQYLDEKCSADAGLAGVGCAEPVHPLSPSAVPSENESSSSASSKNQEAPARSGNDLVSRRRQHALGLMLAIFERSVLPTYKSRFTQFVVFYLCRLSSAFADTFTGRLINNLRNRSLPLVLRVACASYVSSFLSRARFVDDTTVRSALFYLAEYAHRYLDESEQRARALAARAANDQSISTGSRIKQRIGPDGETIAITTGSASIGSRLYSPTVFIAVC